MIRRSGIAAVLMTTALGAASMADDDPAGPRARAGAGGGQGSALLFKRLDANGDGKVSKAEFETLTRKIAERGQGKAGAMGGRVFERLDADNDGSLSAAEFARLQELRARLRGGNARPGIAKGARGIR